MNKKMNKKMKNKSINLWMQQQRDFFQKNKKSLKNPLRILREGVRFKKIIQICLKIK